MSQVLLRSIADPGSQSLPEFDFDPRTRVVFGAGSLDRLGELAGEIGGRRVLLVTDEGIAAAGHEERAVALLTEQGLTVTVFDDLRPNPTTADVDRGLAVAKGAGVEMIVGLGGGSAMDCAKGINFLLTNGGRMQDYKGVGKATKPMLPLLAVPTTSGTGSEAQSFAVIADDRTHMKMACGDKKAACSVAILDPTLTITMPAAVTAATGIDAISHAVETAVTSKRNLVSALFSRQAWKLLTGSFAAVIEEPNNVVARGRMQLGAHLAGAAIENSMLGATHALANPLSAEFGITHGVAIGVMLPHVVRFNAEVVGAIYGELAEAAGVAEASDPDAASKLADFLAESAGLGGLPSSLKDCEIDPARIPEMARAASEQWTGKFNPRAVDTSQFEELYRCAYDAQC